MRIAGHERFAAGTVTAGHNPVVAPLGPFGVARGRPYRLQAATAARVRTCRQDALLVLLHLQECTIERAIPQAPPCQLGNDDHRKPPRQVPAELAFDGQAIHGRPGLGAIVEQVELDRQAFALFLHPRIDALGIRLDERPCLRRNFVPFALGDAANADRAGEHIQFQHRAKTDDARQQVELGAFCSKDFRKPAAAAPPQIIELKQPILRQGIAKAEEEIAIILGKDVRNATLIAFDRDAILQRGTDAAVGGVIRRPATGLRLPPGVELAPSNARSGTSPIDALPSPQPAQQFFRRDFHGMFTWLPKLLQEMVWSADARPRFVETFGLADALARLSTPAVCQVDWDLAEISRG